MDDEGRKIKIADAEQKPVLTVSVAPAQSARKCNKCHGKGVTQYRPGKWQPCDKCGGSGSA